MGNLKQDEPVMLVSAATSAVGFVGSELVSHGVITHTQASTLTQAVVPPVVAALVLVAGVVARYLVTPYSKVRDAMERDGLMSDADFGRIEGTLHEWAHRNLGVDLPPLELTSTADAPPEHQLPAGGGLAAGAPPNAGT